MKEKLIEILETMGYPAYLQGSMSEYDEYPESFFTFWNFDTEEIRHYNNKATFISYGFWVYFYSVNPALVENDQQSGHREYRNNNGNDTRLRRHRNCHQPRPGVSERHRHRTGDTFGMNQ